MSPTDVKLATTPDTLANGSSTGYGFGWFVDEHAGQTRIWHSGGTLGYAAVNEEYPQLGERIIVLTNAYGVEPVAVADAVFDVLHPQLAAAESKAAPGEPSHHQAGPGVVAGVREWEDRSESAHSGGEQGADSGTREEV